MARSALRRAALGVVVGCVLGPMSAYADVRTAIAAAPDALGRGGVVMAAVDPGARARPGSTAKPAIVARVPVRGGNHRGFGRVVFHWQSPVDYSVSRAGDVVVVRFGLAAHIDVAQVAARPPRNVTAIRSEVVGAGSRVTVLIDPAGRLRHFRSGTTIVLDIMGDPEPAPERIAEAAKPASPAPRPAPPPPPMVKPALANAPELAEAPDAVEERVDPAPVAAVRPPAEPKSPPDGEPMVLVGDAAAVARSRRQSAPVPVPSVAQSLGRPAAEVAVPPPPMTVQLRAAGNPTLVSFNGGKALAAAAFVRARHLWVVFSAPYAVDLAGAEGARNSAYDSVSRVPHPEATVLRFKLRDGFGAALRRRGTLWIAYFTKHAEPPAAISVRSIGDDTRGHRVRLALANVARKVEVRDPDDGALLVIVPVASSGAGIVTGRRFPSFDLLPTVQGIVVRPAAEQVEVRTGSGGVDIGLAEGLSLARASRRPAPREPRADGDVAAFDLAVWRRGGDAEFNANRRDLQLAAANAPPGNRTPARIELAQFLFAHGYFVEVLGLLEWLMTEDEEAAGYRQLRAMRGVAELALGHARDAAADLNDPALDGYDDIALWRGVLAVRQGDAEGAAKHFARAGSLWLHELVPHLRDGVGLIAAETALGANDLAAATAYLDAVRAADPKPAVRDRASYLRGRVLWAGGDKEEALKEWAGAADSNDRLARAGAFFYRTSMMLETGEITPRQAIEEWEKLRFSWRGDDFELTLLRQLSEIYVAEREYRKALEAMKRAASQFVGHPTATALSGHMTQLFAEIFAHGGADDLPVRDALTLYYEFRDLTPAGAEGDRVILGLVDRLVAVDLLDRAAMLLDHQVKNRLEGLEKARVGVRLALIRLMDHRPEAALKALDASAVERPPAQLAAQRRHLRTRALADLGRTSAALKLIARDTSRDAALLRADIHWRAGDWTRAAAATEDVIDLTPIETPPSPFASRHILRRAVALALARDRPALDRMHARYAEVMKDAADRYAFDLVTSSVDRENLSFRKLPAALAQVAGFEAFMASYRERVQSQSLSAIN